MLFLAAPGTAHGDPDPGDTPNPTDELFLTALNAAGLHYGQPEQAVKAGRTLCDLADNGKTDGEILAILMKHNDLLSNARANTFMDIAYQTYCPQYLASDS
ncbi:DUF732 domain-containing protein [Mycobacterium sp. M1]|uniref:DUF732 domain-containing protein n=1 Tax=Mycolicibacter acidiphilus TaxID=2835306 RepID=A0ABS5RRW7_9MYCO|nr:DUF732 domain-containing protein [Mycolicibacter acidiphilus]